MEPHFIELYDLESRNSSGGDRVTSNPQAAGSNHARCLLCRFKISERC